MSCIFVRSETSQTTLVFQEIGSATDGNSNATKFRHFLTKAEIQTQHSTVRPDRFNFI